MNNELILIVDDEPGGLKVLSANLGLEGYNVEVSLSGYEAISKIEEKDFDLVLLDYQMPKMNGMEVLKNIRKKGFEIPVIMITAHSTIENAVEAMKSGAYNYITKPLNYDELFILARKAIDSYKTEKKLRLLQKERSELFSFDNIVGQNFEMRKIYNLIKSVADTDVSILVQGETGCGKELVARSIHYNSNRRDKGFTVVDCAALAESLIESELFGHEKGSFTNAHQQKKGKFEFTNGGTIFLDEIGNVSYNVQAKLLRAIERKEFQRVGGNQTIYSDVRVIAATNEDLKQKIKENTFREDLFFRLNVIQINIPPLRKRFDDIPLLTEFFVNKYSEKYNKKIKGINPSLLSKLVEYQWPGNVREFEHLIERMLLLTNKEVLDADCFNAVFTHNSDIGRIVNSNMKPLQEAKSNFEKEYIKQALELYKGNISDTSKFTGIQERNLYEKMKKYDLKKEDFKG
ncbi:MAG: sigma-54 dependent transcriptional regulator [Bacteroidetes bacterium]|nr:sigma-54 dependent transcriptional regulator [Bacteroidota bacterium]